MFYPKRVLWWCSVLTTEFSEQMLARLHECHHRRGAIDSQMEGSFNFSSLYNFVPFFLACVSSSKDELITSGTSGVEGCNGRTLFLANIYPFKQKYLIAFHYSQEITHCDGF
jgi:hypothetical protein